ncbi:MAG: hypothetical protein H6747_13560 [Deltaproteobacteria bacterium]|nr:hypothetical protein [Deltaproteobacteria bacterium]
MRSPLDRPRLLRLLRELGAAASGPGRIYVCGGATALLHGWRGSTIDVDLRLDPEPPGIFAAIALLKEALDVNIELAGPRSFVPPLPGADERAVFIGRHGAVDFFHEDLYGQVLAKLARGHDRDLGDIASAVADGLVEPSTLVALFAAIEPELLRYPGLNPAALRRRVEEFGRDGR